FTVVPSSFDESSVSVSSPEKYVKILAESKASDVSERYPEQWVIGADTIVCAGDNILGKPESGRDALRMLMQLSGRLHHVITGYSICCKKNGHSFTDSVTTEVIFKNLTKNEIDWYIGTQEPFDKAGAYAIQGLASRFVKLIKGSYTNVVGLPVCEVIESLKKTGKYFENKIEQH
ncbi:MAG: septum formation protein Maf, partial [Deltaproteobacteria bacterium]|nr:septum formation protein Maf [Deltaproteobacteria bacterium]